MANPHEAKSVLAVRVYSRAVLQLLLCTVAEYFGGSNITRRVQMKCYDSSVKSLASFGGSCTFAVLRSVYSLNIHNIDEGNL